MSKFMRIFSMLLVLVFVPILSYSSDGFGIDGSKLSLLYTIPFVCMLMSIAICPVLMPHIWHNHFGKIAVFWSLMFVIPYGITHGFNLSLYEVGHVLILDYIPFITLLFALFTVAGGIQITGNLVGKPCVNTVLLLVASILSSVMGTTGSSMLFIRPLLNANAHRKYKTHTVIFFIFLVANIGGSLTPIGDPPLFLGFLKGVPFGWTLTHMLPLVIFVEIPLLIIYFLLDSYYYKKENSPVVPSQGGKFGIEGKFNLALIVMIVASVLISGTWKPNFSFLNTDGAIVFFEKLTHIPLTFPNLLRDIFLFVVALVSLQTTSRKIRENNNFNWDPILEVAKLFIGIFITMVPALAILNAGKNGALSSVVSLVTTTDGEHIPRMYFFITGLLSSFLDNAPTYLVFFTSAGGMTDLTQLVTVDYHTLVAISAGAVFMGANTYIGNAPNFMVRSIAEKENVKMPSFFGYMGWSMGILMPLFIILSLIFF